MAVIKVCSETPFSKKLYHVEVGQVICKSINLLVSIWYEFLLKGISEQTIVKVFLKDMLDFKKQSNIDSLTICYLLTLPFRLNSSKWKTLYWVECYVNYYVYFNFLLLLTSFSGYNVSKVSKYKVSSCSYFPLFELNMGKYRPQKTPYLDTFYALKILCFRYKK